MFTLRSIQVAAQFAARVAAGALLLTASLHAASITPSFGTAPTGWFQDRYAPAGFTSAGPYMGMSNVLAISIANKDGLANRPMVFQSAFYNTQGRDYDITGGAGSSLDAALYIPTEWSDANANGNVRTDMWGVMSDGHDTTDYTMIGFTNYGGAARLRVWDPWSGWVNLATPIEYDAWNTFSILFTGTAYQYSVNGATVATFAASDGTTGFRDVDMQAYNFNDASLGANARDYTAYWANVGGASPTPEPGPFALAGAGLVALGLLRRRVRKA